jgi:phage-related protein
MTQEITKEATIVFAIEKGKKVYWTGRSLSFYRINAKEYNKESAAKSATTILKMRYPALRFIAKREAA